MRQNWLMVGSFLCITGAMPGRMSAQDVADVAFVPSIAFRSTPSQEKSANVLATQFDIDLQDVPLRAALDEIVRASGVSVMYSPSVIPIDKRVSVRGKGISLGDALKQVLAHSGTEAQVANPGRVVVARIASVAAKPVQGTIVGKVIHAKTKQPVMGAKITIDGAGTNVTTGQDGSFRVSVAAGEWMVRVGAVGFVRQAKRVQVSDAQSVTIEIALEPSASVLDEVVVTGTVVATERKAIPTPITVITASDIEKRGITRIEELLRGDVPGVVALDIGTFAWTENNKTNQGLGSLVTATVYSRGSSGKGRFGGTATPLKTFIDGVELLDPSYLGTIDPRSVERIEVITGPQAATIYGAGAMGGVMQIFTKKGAGTSSRDFTANLRYGLLESNLSNGLTPTHNHTLTLTGGIGPAFSYSSTVSYDYAGQWQPDLFSRRIGASAGLTSRIDPVTITGSVSTTASSNGTGTYISGGMLGNVFRSNGTWTVSAIPTQTQRVSKTSNQTLALTVDHRINSVWQQSATVGRSQNVFTMVPESPQRNSPSDTLFRHSQANGQRTNWSYNTTNTGSLASILSLNMTIGASGSFGNQTRATGCTAIKKATSLIGCSTGSSVDVTTSLDDQSWGGFGNWRVGIFEQLYLTFGLRAERNPNYGEDHKIDWTPTNGLAYTVAFRDVTLKLLASYGRATRTPPADARETAYYTSTWSTPSTLLSQKANPALRPEYSRGPQGGLELYLGNRGSVTVNHYHQRVTDLLQSIYVDSVPYSSIGDPSTYWWSVTQWQNVATVRQLGWDVTGSLNVAFLSFQGTYSWSDSRVLSIDESAADWFLESPGSSFSGVLTHTGNFGVTYALRGTRISTNTSVIGRSLISGVVRQGDDSWYYTAQLARHKMYLNFAPRSAGNAIFSKPGYTKTNINVSQRLNPWASVTVDVVNVGNTFDADGTEAMRFNPTLGRQTRIGVSLRSRR